MGGEEARSFPDLAAVTGDDTIFITGATGFLGGAIAAELLDRENPARLLFLVRAAQPLEGLQRLRNALSKFDVSDEKTSALTTENIICGDLMGVSAFGNDARLDAVTYAVNCAGMTSFGKNPHVRRINVDGTLELSRLISAMPRLRRFVHVSTAMVCGATPPRVVTESTLSASDSRHLVPYTETKAEAEQLIFQTMQGLPCVIVRPTIIVGHSRHGCKPSHSIFWAFRMGDALRITTTGVDAKIDVIPVDYAAQAILHLMAKPSLSHDLYHVGSGTESSSTFREIDSAFSKVLKRNSRDYHECTIEEAMARKDEYPSLFGPCNKRFMQGAMKLYGSFAALDSIFDTSRLLAEGAPPPPAFAAYLGLCHTTSEHLTIAEQAITDFQ